MPDRSTVLGIENMLSGEKKRCWLLRQWTYNSTTYKGLPAQWYYDTTGMFAYLGTYDTSGANILAIAFYETSATVKPTPGKYYFVNSAGSNIPNGVSPSQICIMEVGPSDNPAVSVGGTAADTATVSLNSENKLVIFFSNIAVTGGRKASGTLIE